MRTLRAFIEKWDACSITSQAEVYVQLGKNGEKIDEKEKNWGNK